MNNLPKKVKLLDDPWSLQLKDEIKNLFHYKTIMQWKLNKDITMEDTVYYNVFMELIKQNGSMWDGKITTKEEVTNQYKRFQELYNLTPNWNNNDLVSVIYQGTTYYFGPITAKILDNGSIMLNDGRHRMASLLANNLPIEIVICERSEKWQQTMDDLSKIDSKLYQPIVHPDFQDWQVFNKEDEKLRIVNQFLKEGNVLDLGCCYGYTLYQLRNRIKKGIGVELNKTRFQITKNLFDMIGYEIYCDDMLNFLETDINNYDTIMALAVLHHFSAGNPIDKFVKLIDIIANKTNCFIYELPTLNEERGSWLYKDFDMDAYIKSKFNQFQEEPNSIRKIVCVTK